MCTMSVFFLDVISRSVDNRLNYWAGLSSLMMTIFNLYIVPILNIKNGHLISVLIKSAFKQQNLLAG